VKRLHRHGLHERQRCVHRAQFAPYRREHFPFAAGVRDPNVDVGQ
jgi:hypothetical protein